MVDAVDPIAGLPLVDPLAIPDGPSQINALAKAVSTKLVLVYKNAAARDQALPYPTPGMLTFLESDSTYYVYRNGEWIVAWSDSGWAILPITATGWTAETGNPPQFRKIGDRISLRGIIRSTVASPPGKVCDIPAEARPKVITVCPVASSSNVISTAARMSINNTDISIAYGGAIAAGTYFYLSEFCSYWID